MSQRIVDEPAFLLHSRVYGETSEIGEFFTRNHGKLPVMMRARRGSKKNPRLLQGRQYRVTLVGTSDILQLTACEMQDSRQLDATGGKLLSMLYVCELLHALLQRGDTAETLFDAFARWQVQLQSEQFALHLRRFEWLLLESLGYGLDIGADMQGEPINPDARYWVNPNRGFFRCSSANEPGVYGRVLAQLSMQSELDSQIDTEHQLRQLTRFLLEYRLAGKAIRSWQLGASLTALKRQISNGTES